MFYCIISTKTEKKWLSKIENTKEIIVNHKRTSMVKDGEN